MITLTDTDYTLMQVIMWLGVIAMILPMVLVRNFYLAKIWNMLGKGKVILRADLDGIARFGNQKTEMGYFKDKDSQTQIAADRVVKTNDGDIYIQTEGFGLSYDLPVATAEAFLTRMGFMSLKDALIKYDDDYFDKDKHPDNWEVLQKAKTSDGMADKTDFEALETIRRRIPGAEKVRNIAIKRVLEDARTKLIRMDIEWINEWTIPLGILYSWGLQNQGSMNNKNIYEKGILKTKQENIQQGWTQEKTMGMAITALVIIVGGAIAFVIISGSGVFNSGPAVTPTVATTTTTLHSTATTIVATMRNLTK